MCSWEERIVELPVAFKGAWVCFCQEVVPGVFLSNAIVKPRDWSVFVGLINVNEDEMNLGNFRLEFQKLSDYRLWRTLTR